MWDRAETGERNIAALSAISIVEFLQYFSIPYRLLGMGGFYFDHFPHCQIYSSLYLATISNYVDFIVFLWFIVLWCAQLGFCLYTCSSVWMYKMDTHQLNRIETIISWNAYACKTQKNATYFCCWLLRLATYASTKMCHPKPCPADFDHFILWSIHTLNRNGTIEISQNRFIYGILSEPDNSFNVQNRA